MPYGSAQEAEARIRGLKDLPSRAKQIWVSAFNSATKTNSEEDAIKIAWAAVKRKYTKEGERWMAKAQKAEATYGISGDKIAIGIPFEKVNIDERTIEGFATLDNVDKTNEVVDFDASREAFKSWMGNIREMHGPKAVGKALSFGEKEYETDGKVYNGIYVKAYISKGANDTWEKILDGTLKGFSIGGRVLEKRPDVLKNDGDFDTRHVVRITKYNLGELSVVDNPANPLALFSDNKTEKAVGAMLLKYEGGELEPTEVISEEQNVFYCKECDIAKLESAESEATECVTCDKNMDFIATSYYIPEADELKKMVMNKYSSKQVIHVGAKEDLEEPEEIEKVSSTPVDEERHELLNNDKDDNKVKDILTSLYQLITNKMDNPDLDSSGSNKSDKGGEQDSVELTNILDVLKGAAEKVEEFIKATGTKLNDEDKSGTSPSNPNDVTVADKASLPSAEVSSEDVKPQVSGTPANANDTGALNAGTLNVMPQIKSDETPADDQSAVLKSVLTEQMDKISAAVSEKIAELDNKVAEVNQRLEKYADSGAERKSGEVEGSDEIKKSSTESFWGGAFYAGEF